jgi:uncharacterized membrane protein
LFAWTFFADIVYIASDESQSWYDIAYWSGIAAVVTALSAAFFGLADFLTLAWQSDARGVGLLHATMNVTTVVLFAIAALLMFDNGAMHGARLTTVFVLHALGAGTVSLGGFLGGEMVYRYHLGMAADDTQAERAEVARHERARVHPRPQLRGR